MTAYFPDLQAALDAMRWAPHEIAAVPLPAGDLRDLERFLGAIDKALARQQAAGLREAARRLREGQR